MFIDENTPRRTLEEVAIMECCFDRASVEAASDSFLLGMIQGWIEAGDECEAA